MICHGIGLYFFLFYKLGNLFSIRSSDDEDYETGDEIPSFDGGAARTKVDSIFLMHKYLKYITIHFGVQYFPSLVLTFNF